jgi:hypothetical protein
LLNSFLGVLPHGPNVGIGTQSFNALLKAKSLNQNQEFTMNHYGLKQFLQRKKGNEVKKEASLNVNNCNLLDVALDNDLFLVIDFFLNKEVQNDVDRKDRCKRKSAVALFICFSVDNHVHVKVGTCNIANDYKVFPYLIVDIRPCNNNHMHHVHQSFVPFDLGI